MSAELPKGWKRVALGQCCQIISGATPSRDVPEYWDGDIPWVTPKDISKLNQPVLDDAPEKITQAGYAACSTSLMPAGSILFSSRAPIGLVAIAGRKMCTNQGFKSLVPGKDVDSGFLYWTMKRNAPRVAALGNGATFKEVSKEIVAKFEIDLPPLDDQRRIAAILDKADAIRRKRQQALALADDFLRSAFLAHYSSTKHMHVSQTMNDLAIKRRNSFVNGPFGSNLVKAELRDEGVPVIYIRDIRDGVYERVSRVFVTTEKAEELASCNVKPGDVLIAKVGDPPGTAAVYPTGEPDGVVTQDVIRIRVDTAKVMPQYLVLFMNSPYGNRLLQPIIVEATRSRIGLGQLKALSINLPHIDKQRDFLRCIAPTGPIKRRQLMLADDAANLFAALSQRAFRGEL